DLLVTSGGAATLAAKAVSRRVPVAFASRDIDDGLAPPGDNVTGVALTTPELSVKWVELMHEAAPGARRMAILWDPTSPRAQLRSAEAAARSLDLDVITVIG